MEYILVDMLKEENHLMYIQGVESRIFYENSQWNVISFHKGTEKEHYSGDSLAKALIAFREVECKYYPEKYPNE